MRLNTDSDGYCYWHIADHGRDELWRHMNEAQKVATTILEKDGWQLVRVDRDKFRQAYLHRDGESLMTVINRS